MCVSIPIDHFKIEELVDKATFEYWQHNPSVLWGLFDDRALATLVALRRRFGPCSINDWYWGGSYQYSGFRPPHCSIGAELSQHKFGRAFDCKFANYSAEEVRDYVLNHPEEFPYITHIEGDVDWFHFDTRAIPDDVIAPVIFYPKGKK